MEDSIPGFSNHPIDQKVYIVLQEMFIKNFWGYKNFVQRS